MNVHFSTVAETAFKAALSNLAASVSVVTTLAGERPVGLTASSVTAFSAQPPCVAVNIHTGTMVGRAVGVGSALCINLLAQEQRGIASVFAGRTETINRFSTGQWRPMRSGAPALAGAVANIDCIVEDIVKRHTHAIVIARVIDIAASETDRPLLYWQREFTQLPA